ncbi:MAG: flippase-like domain-containing protein [Clostridia bacterium]|nr:flippase-like domain-containing protein [Clostridia bacterium]
MKLTKRTRSNVLNALIIVVTLGLVLYLSARGGDISDAWDTLRSADLKWIGAAICSWVVFMTFEAMGLHVFFHQQKVRIKFRTSFLVALIGSFYSSVTPAATGGQPMQVFALKKRGVPAGISSSGLAVKFFTFQTALLTLGGGLWLLNPGIVQTCVEAGRWIVVTGFLLNGLSVLAVILLAINKNIVRGILTLCINIGKALRIVKDVGRTTSRADAAMEDFHASVDMLTHHPIRLFYLYLLSCLQVLGLMSIVYFVYRALGLDALRYVDVLTLQFLLYIAASFTPLPGASGAQEGGFYIFFQNVFPAEKLVGALLLWRFFTYYFTLIIGVIGIVIDSAWSIRHPTGSTILIEGGDDDAGKEKG